MKFFKKILSLGSLVQQFNQQGEVAVMPPTMAEEAKVKEEKKLQQEVDFLLEMGKYETFFSMVKHGYRATPEQQGVVANQFVKCIDTLDKIHSKTTGHKDIETLQVFFDNSYKITSATGWQIYHGSLMQDYLLKHYLSFFASGAPHEPAQALSNLEKEHPAIRELMNAMKVFIDDNKDELFTRFHKQLTTIFEPLYANYSIEQRLKDFYANVLLPYQLFRDDLLERYEFLELKEIKFSLEQQRKSDIDAKRYFIQKNLKDVVSSLHPGIYDKLDTMTFTSSRFYSSSEEHGGSDHNAWFEACDYRRKVEDTEESCKHSPQFKQKMQEMEKFFPTMTTQGLEFINMFIQDFSNHHDHNQKMIDKAKKHYSMEALIQQAIEMQQQHVSSLQVSQLPRQGQQLLEVIHQLGSKLRETPLDPEAKLFVDNIFEQVLPRAIGKYLNMDAQARDTYKDDSQLSITDHFIQSLKNLEGALQDRLSQAIENHNDKALHEMKVTQAYTRALRG